MPGTRLTARAVDVLAALRFLRYTKAKVSPRALRYEFEPDREARIVLEPWEQDFTLKGSEHNYTEQKTIRTWGRRRLRLIEPLLPFAEQVDIYLKGRALPSFYAVKLPGITFVLGLSGWTGQRWTESGGFSLLSPGGEGDGSLLERALFLGARSNCFPQSGIDTSIRLANSAPLKCASRPHDAKQDISGVESGGRPQYAA